MKNRIRILSLLISCVLLSLLMITTVCGVSVSDVSSEQQQEYLQNLDIQVLTEEPEKAPFCCYNVSTSGVIAIGRDYNMRKAVVFYRADGTFYGGFSFEDSGSFFLHWKKDRLLLYLVRSSLVVTLCTDGTVENVQASDDVGHYRDVLCQTEQLVRGRRYSAKSISDVITFFTARYGKLVVTIGEGEEQVLYDATGMQLFQILFGAVIVLLMALVIFLYHYKRKNRESHKEKQPDRPI